MPSRILVVAATDHELAVEGEWARLRCGIGPVEAAASTMAAIARERPLAILHVGIAGARRAASLPPPTLVIGLDSLYTDLAVPPEWAPSVVSSASRLIDAAHAALPAAVIRRIGTSARVGGTTDCEVEAMEGFGVLRAAQLAGIPALEVRSIANEIEEADRTRWQFAAAFAAITDATPILVRALAAIF